MNLLKLFDYLWAPAPEKRKPTEPLDSIWMERFNSALYERAQEVRRRLRPRVEFVEDVPDTFAGFPVRELWCRHCYGEPVGIHEVSCKMYVPPCFKQY